MAKKVKKAHERKDKFYHLARETGYRSRAAFKLIQLNRKHHFLENSNICIDLCAAPGSWLQVAHKNMPVSSIIIGVDLDPIRSIPGVITLKQDITTPECISSLKKQLQGNKANLILNDGAPNVGTSWEQDAFNQVRLGLYGLRIAIELLSSGGCLVTKVFRSCDYPKLLAKLREFFKTVSPTKPPASRTESAEIYVVCQDFKSVNKTVLSSLDPNLVFADTNDTVENEKRSVSINRLQKPSINRTGYSDGVTLLHKSSKISDFLKSSDFMSFLADSNELVIDSEFVLNHKETTEEIIEYCKDLKVLGKSEIKLLLRWRKRLIKDLNEKNRKEKPQAVLENVSEVDQDEIENKDINDLIQKISKHEAKEEKKKCKKERKKIIAENQRINKKLSFKNDYFEQTEGIELFSMEALPDDILNKINADEILDEKMSNHSESESIASTNYTVDDQEMSHPPSISSLEDEKDEVNSKEKPIKNLETNNKTTKFDSNDSVDEVPIKIPKRATIDASGYHDHRLNACERALARELIKSKKRRREIEELGFNRYSYDDKGTDLPSWFIKDEKVHCRINMPVTREQSALERERNRAINARPPKKIIEAKVRRKKKLAAKLQGARKKADLLAETDDITAVEKNKQIKEIYKKAGIYKKKQQTKLIPVKKGAGKKAARPRGVKGKFKLVDRKMKSDKGAKRQKKKNDRPNKRFRR